MPDLNEKCRKCGVRVRTDSLGLLACNCDIAGDDYDDDQEDEEDLLTYPPGQPFGERPPEGGGGGHQDPRNRVP